jgi:thioredoxin reductase (NADPH)
VRGDSLAAGMSAYPVQELKRVASISVRLHTEVIAVHGTGRLEALTVGDNTTGRAETLPTAASSATAGLPGAGRWTGHRC